MHLCHVKFMPNQLTRGLRVSFWVKIYDKHNPKLFSESWSSSSILKLTEWTRWSQPHHHISVLTQWASKLHLQSVWHCQSQVQPWAKTRNFQRNLLHFLFFTKKWHTIAKSRVVIFHKVFNHLLGLLLGNRGPKDDYFTFTIPLVYLKK